MNIQPMNNVPKKRSEFERNINTLAELIENRRFVMARNDGNERMGKSLQKVRSLPNQRINFLSVEVGARAIVNLLGSFNSISKMAEEIDKDKLTGDSTV